MRLALLLAALALLSSGCASPSAQEAQPVEVGPGPDRVAGEPVEDDEPGEPVAVSSGRTVAPVKPTPQRIVFTAKGTTAANAAGWGADTALALGIRALDLYVPPGSSGLVIEVGWAAPQDLDLEVHAPPRDFNGLPADPTGWGRCYAGLPSPGVWCDVDGHIGAPDGPIALRLTQADLASSLSTRCDDAGDDWGDCNVYAVGLRSKDANVQLAWTVAATVFIGEDPPSDYHVL